MTPNWGGLPPESQHFKLFGIAVIDVIIESALYCDAGYPQG